MDDYEIEKVVEWQLLYLYQIKQSMNKGRGRLVEHGQMSIKFYQMLKIPSITPQNLFNEINMNEDVRQNIQYFLKFCLKNKQFTSRLFKICLNSPYQELYDQKVKKVAQYTLDALINDQDALCNFLFHRKGHLKNGSDNQEIIDDSLKVTIQSEAESLFNDGSANKEEAYWEKQADAFQKHQLLAMSLVHLKEQIQNQTCLGYINKLYSSLLRREGNLFLQFLKERPEYIDVLINNIDHYSIGNIVAIVLSAEDKSGQYKHEELKKQIMTKILCFGFENVGSTQKFDGFLSTVEQILNTTKQSYYQYFQDFKRCANILVSEQNLRKFYAFLFKDSVSFGNASSLFQTIIKRINCETDDHDNHQTQSTMKFEHGFLYNQFVNLLQLIKQSQSYESTMRVTFLNFLINLFKSIKNIQINLSNEESFKKIMSVFRSEKQSGLVKNYLFQLMKILINRMLQPEIQNISQWLIGQQLVQECNLDKNFQRKNNNQTSCFIVSLLFELQEKDNTFLKKYTENGHSSLDGVYNEFQTKLAGFGIQSNKNFQDDEQIELVMKFPSRNQQITSLFTCYNQSSNNKQKQQGQTVGKNHVIIPVLHLPNKNNTKVIIEEQKVQQMKTPIDLSRQALIRDLKNSRFNIPERLKKKKIQQQPKNIENKVDVEKQQKQKKFLNINLQREQEIIFLPTKYQKQNNDYLTILPPSPPKVKLPNGILQQEQKYFIRHFLLF